MKRANILLSLVATTGLISWTVTELRVVTREYVVDRAIHLTGMIELDIILLCLKSLPLLLICIWTWAHWYRAKIAQDTEAIRAAAQSAYEQERALKRATREGSIWPPPPSSGN